MTVKPIGSDPLISVLPFVSFFIQIKNFMYDKKINKHYMERFMAVRCCSCNYVMRTNQEIQSAIIKAGFDIRDIFFGGLGQNICAGHLNSGRNAIKCPKCGKKGRFEDV